MKGVPVRLISAAGNSPGGIVKKAEPVKQKKSVSNEVGR